MGILVIATHNAAKFKEIKRGLSQFIGRVKVMSLRDLRIKNKVEESGQTFEGNARIKAKFYGNLLKLPTVADDAGLIIPFLNNEPGVKSRRWLGRDSTDDELINFTLNKLKGQKGKNRIAYLEVFLCFFDEKTKKMICSNGKIKGHIAPYPSKKRIEGYPFRSLFIVDEFDKYYEELTEEEHEQVNHRLIAVKKLAKKIESLI